MQFFVQCSIRDGKHCNGQGRRIVKMDVVIYRVAKNPEFGLWQMQVQMQSRKGPSSS